MFDFKKEKYVMWQLHPSPHHIPLEWRWRVTILACGVVLDVLDQFRGFRAPGGWKSLSSTDWRYRLYNSVCTSVLHCDYVIMFHCRSFVVRWTARLMWIQRHFDGCTFISCIKMFWVT